MAKIWFCRSCGYEVPARGRCHSCGNRLERSPLEELPSMDEDEEVGYDLDGWAPSGRGRLIVDLIEAGVEHRFEDEELVVAVDDEERTDDIVAAITAEAEAESPAGSPAEGSTAEAVPAGGADRLDEQGADEHLRAEVQVLAHAAQRLRVDPTDMQADADVAQASAAVFAADDFFAVDEDTWAAVGRVTRRLLGALGAEEALEDEIRKQAAILAKLLDPVFAGEFAGGVTSMNDDEDQGAALDVPAAAGSAVGSEADGDGVAVSPSTETIGAGGVWVPEEGFPEDPNAVEGGRGEAVYELPDWLPEQRAQLSLLLDDEGIGHRWERGDLIVPEAEESRAEALFDRVEGVETPEDDEARYRALEELFAAVDRFVGDPGNRTKAAEVVRTVGEADGPTPLGLDDAQWWAIRTRARTLADALEHGGNREVALGEAGTLRDLLRALV